MFGRKINIGILNDRFYGVITVDGEEYRLDNIVSSELTSCLITQAKRVYDIFECSSPVIVELILTNVNEYIISIDTAPNLSINNKFMKIFNKFDIPYYSVINSLITN